MQIRAVLTRVDRVTCHGDFVLVFLDRLLHWKGDAALCILCQLLEPAMLPGRREAVRAIVRALRAGTLITIYECECATS